MRACEVVRAGHVLVRHAYPPLHALRMQVRGLGATPAARPCRPWRPAMPPVRSSGPPPPVVLPADIIVEGKRAAQRTKRLESVTQSVYSFKTSPAHVHPDLL